MCGNLEASLDPIPHCPLSTELGNYLRRAKPKRLHCQGQLEVTAHPAPTHFPPDSPFT